MSTLNRKPRTAKPIGRVLPRDLRVLRFVHKAREIIAPHTVPTLFVSLGTASRRLMRLHAAGYLAAYQASPNLHIRYALDRDGFAAANLERYRASHRWRQQPTTHADTMVRLWATVVHECFSRPPFRLLQYTMEHEFKIRTTQYRPDSIFRIAARMDGGDAEIAGAVEVDCATTSVSVFGKKLQALSRLRASGIRLEGTVTPRVVLVTTPHLRRATAIARVANRYPNVPLLITVLTPTATTGSLTTGWWTPQMLLAGCDPAAGLTTALRGDGSGAHQ